MYLSPLRTDEEAIEAYTRWMNDHEVLQWIGRNTSVKTYDNEVDWVEAVIRRDDEIIFNIIDAETDELCGNCTIRDMGVRNYNLGIIIGEPDSRNKGFGTETIRLLIKFCFEELGAHRVFLSVMDDNYRARACYKKAGMKECGWHHECRFYGGKFHDLIFMEILEQEYFASKY